LFASSWYIFLTCILSSLPLDDSVGKTEAAKSVTSAYQETRVVNRG